MHRTKLCRHTYLIPGIHTLPTSNHMCSRQLPRIAERVTLLLLVSLLVSQMKETMIPSETDVEMCGAGSRQQWRTSHLPPYMK
jgi:hypothetical protein